MTKVLHQKIRNKAYLVNDIVSRFGLGVAAARAHRPAPPVATRRSALSALLAAAVLRRSPLAVVLGAGPSAAGAAATAAAEVPAVVAARGPAAPWRPLAVALVVIGPAAVTAPVIIIIINLFASI